MPQCYLGKDAELYVNTGQPSTPVWTRVGNVRDLTLNGDKTLADVTARDSNGYRQQCPALKDMSVDFVMNFRGGSDANWTLFRDSFLNDTVIECLVMTGDKDATAGEHVGIQASFGVNTWTENQPLEESINYNVSMVIAPDTVPTPVVSPIT